MLNTILLIAQFAILIAIAVLLWQLWRKFKSIPEDESIGEERSKYLNARLNALTVCVIAEAVLSVAHKLLRLFLNQL